MPVLLDATDLCVERDGGLASAPPLKVAVDDDGAIRSEIWIGAHQRLRLLGRPISDGNAVLVTLIDSAGSNTRAECADFRVIIDGQSRAVQQGFRAVPGSSSALQSLLNPAVLLAIGWLGDNVPA